MFPFPSWGNPIILLVILCIVLFCKLNSTIKFVIAAILGITLLAVLNDEGGCSNPNSSFYVESEEERKEKVKQMDLSYATTPDSLEMIVNQEAEDETYYPIKSIQLSSGNYYYKPAGHTNRYWQDGMKHGREDGRKDYEQRTPYASYEFESPYPRGTGNTYNAGYWAGYRYEYKGLSRPSEEEVRMMLQKQDSIEHPYKYRKAKEPQRVKTNKVKHTSADLSDYRRGYNRGYNDGESDGANGSEYGLSFSNNGNKEYSRGYANGYENGYNDSH